MQSNEFVTFVNLFQLQRFIVDIQGKNISHIQKLPSKEGREKMAIHNNREKLILITENNQQTL